jgi:hypothetical protein
MSSTRVSPQTIASSRLREAAPESATASITRSGINNYGIPVVNSAGNKNRAASEFSPTSLLEVIVVAGTDWNNYGYGAGAPLSCNTEFCGSNWGPEIDLFAPAVDILGAMVDAWHSWA